MLNIQQTYFWIHSYHKKSKNEKYIYKMFVLPMQEDKNKSEGVERRKIQFGSNQITHPPGKTWFQLAWEELEDLMLRVLIVCGFISMIVGAIEHPNEGWIDGMFLFIILLFFSIRESVILFNIYFQLELFPKMIKFPLGLIML